MKTTWQLKYIKRQSRSSSFWLDFYFDKSQSQWLLTIHVISSCSGDDIKCQCLDLSTLDELIQIPLDTDAPQPHDARPIFPIFDPHFMQLYFSVVLDNKLSDLVTTIWASTIKTPFKQYGGSQKDWDQSGETPVVWSITWSPTQISPLHFRHLNFILLKEASYVTSLVRRPKTCKYLVTGHTVSIISVYGLWLVGNNQFLTPKVMVVTVCTTQEKICSCKGIS